MNKSSQKSKSVYVEIPEDVLRKAEIGAAENNMTINQYIIFLLSGEYSPTNR